MQYKEKGDDSGLHTFMFSKRKQRGSTRAGPGVGDIVADQILAKINHVDQRNNILIMGVANRIDDR